MYVMNRVLKDNKVVQASSRNKVDAFIEFMVQKMDLILSAPEDILIKEGDTVESKNLLLIFIENDNMYFIA